MAYLDHAATTPMVPAAMAAMTAQLGASGNASSLHAAGRRARRVVEESREELAAALGARPSEVVFTGGGTLADNLAIKGLYWARRAADPRRRRVIISSVEHHAVGDPARWLAAEQGALVSTLPVDATGRVLPAALEAELAAGGGPDTVALVSVMWANNEVGTIQPIAELVEITRSAGVPLHTDAIQAVGALPVDFSASGVDAMTVTGHKFGGPVGAGALFVRRGVELTPLVHGGGQERDVHSGTLDVPAIAGLAAAATEAVATREDRVARLGALRARLVEGVLAAVPDAVLAGHPSEHLPGVAHLSFPGCEGDALLMLLDAQGVECSTGSACTAGIARPSHVLLAMGAAEEQARSCLRFSLGHPSTEAEVDAVIAAIGPAVARARRALVPATEPRG